MNISIFRLDHFVPTLLCSIVTAVCQVRAVVHAAADYLEQVNTGTLWRAYNLKKDDKGKVTKDLQRQG